MVRGTIVRRLTTVALAAALTACSEPITAPTAPTAPTTSEESGPPLTDVQGPALIECSVARPRFVWDLIGPLGGLLSLDGHSISISQGALLRFALITVRQPATPFVELEARVNFRPHFEFEQEVEVVLDYSRCEDSQLGPGPVSVWQIDPDTKELKVDMGGVDDRANKRITFRTNHFSGYAVAQ